MWKHIIEVNAIKKHIKKLKKENKKKEKESTKMKYENKTKAKDVEIEKLQKI